MFDEQSNCLQVVLSPKNVWTHNLSKPISERKVKSIVRLGFGRVSGRCILIPERFWKLFFCCTLVTKNVFTFNNSFIFRIKDPTAVQWWRSKKNYAHCVPHFINDVIIIMTYQWKFQTFLQSSKVAKWFLEWKKHLRRMIIIVFVRDT